MKYTKAALFVLASAICLLTGCSLTNSGTAVRETETSILVNDFELTLRLADETYSIDDTTLAQATVTYLGERDVITIHSASSWLTYFIFDANDELIFQTSAYYILISTDFVPGVPQAKEIVSQYFKDTLQENGTYRLRADFSFAVAEHGDIEIFESLELDFTVECE